MTTTAQLNPQTDASHFDLKLALKLADFSRRAYETDPCAELQSGALRNSLLDDPFTDGRVLIEDIGDAIVLAFRGTKGVRNWLVDLDVDLAPIAKDIKVHSGFLTAAESLFPKIVARLVSPGADRALVKPLILTGHSLGGALATLTAYLLQQDGFRVRSVYTFASPRCGNAGFRRVYDALLGFKTFRVACAGDLVPLLPGLLAGYRHVGQECLLSPPFAAGGSHVTVNGSHALEILCDAGRVWFALQRRNYDFILQFHSLIQDYIPLLEQVSNP